MRGREEGWPTSCLHGWLHLYPNIPTCTALPLGAKSACSTQSAVAFYHLAVGQSVCKLSKWVYLCLCVCVCMCVSSSVRAHTHLLMLCAFMDTELRTTLPLWFIFKQTAQPSRLPHLRFSLPLLSISLMLTANPSILQIFHLSSLPLIHLFFQSFYSSIHFSMLLYIHPSICIYFPAGKTISWIPLKWKDFTFNTSPTLVMCPSFRGRGSKEERKDEEGVRRDFWWVDGWKRWWHYLYQNMSVSLNLSKSNFSGRLRSFNVLAC